MASLKLTLPYYLLCFLFISFINFNVHALNVGLQVTGVNVHLGKECSRKCESEFCSVPPLLKYGKYCGVLYSGCRGETPCDGLDACCMNHDICVAAKAIDSSMSFEENTKIKSANMQKAETERAERSLQFFNSLDNYLSQECSKQLLDCMENFNRAGAHSFKGSTCDAKDVTKVIKFFIEAALLAGGVLRHP